MARFNFLLTSLAMVGAVLASPVSVPQPIRLDPKNGPILLEWHNGTFVKRAGEPAVFRPVECLLPPSSFSRSLDLPRQDLDRTCRRFGYAGASLINRYCGSGNIYHFECYGEGLQRFPENDECPSTTHMCLETEGNSGNLAAPGYTGARGIICMQVGETAERDAEPGSYGVSTSPIQASQPTGKMYGQMELKGNVQDMHFDMRWSSIVNGESYELGSKHFGGSAAKGYTHTYNIIDDYTNDAQFYGTVTGLDNTHGYVGLTIFASFGNL